MQRKMFYSQKEVDSMLFQLEEKYSQGFLGAIHRYGLLITLGSVAGFLICLARCRGVC